MYISYIYVLDNQYIHYIKDSKLLHFQFWLCQLVFLWPQWFSNHHAIDVWGNVKDIFKNKCNESICFSTILHLMITPLCNPPYLKLRVMFYFFSLTVSFVCVIWWWTTNIVRMTGDKKKRWNLAVANSKWIVMVSITPLQSQHFILYPWCAFLFFSFPTHMPFISLLLGWSNWL